MIFHFRRYFQANFLGKYTDHKAFNYCVTPKEVYCHLKNMLQDYGRSFVVKLAFCFLHHTPGQSYCRRDIYASEIYSFGSTSYNQKKIKLLASGYLDPIQWG